MNFYISYVFSTTEQKICPLCELSDILSETDKKFLVE